MLSQPLADTRDLDQLQSADESIASEAFTRLWATIRDRLARWLRHRGIEKDAYEDLLQVVATRLWESRESFDLPSHGAWWKLACRVARNLLIDEARKHSFYLEVHEEDDIPDLDLPYLDVILAMASDRETIFEQADCLWLGSIESETKAEADLKLLVAQLYYLHQIEVSQIHRILNLPATQHLDSWLLDPNVIRHMAYRELYVGNDELAGIVLRPEQPYTSAELDELTRKAYSALEEPPSGWTWEDFLIAIWRIRNALRIEQILRSERCQLNKEQLEQKFANWRESYPFSKKAADLLKTQLGSSSIECFRSSGLWRRLVFQYHAVDELAYKQILERTDPATNIFGLELTEARLTGWIGMGRMWSQLAAAFQVGANNGP